MMDGNRRRMDKNQGKKRLTGPHPRRLRRTTMKAIAYNEYGSTEVLRLVEIPKPTVDNDNVPGLHALPEHHVVPEELSQKTLPNRGLSRLSRS